MLLKPVLQSNDTDPANFLFFLESREQFIPVPDGSAIKFVFTPIITCKAFTWIETAAKIAPMSLCLKACILGD